MTDRRSDAIFAKISKRYDLLNSLLSLGQEQKWRRRAVDHLPPGRLLDLGSGTGAAAGVFGDRIVVALDPVPEMLALSPIPPRVVAFGERLPFADDSFDSVFSAYVFRNLDSVADTIDEIARILKPGGAAGIVDLTRPNRPATASLHRAGTSVVLPLAGWTIGAADEYRYLHESLDSLPPPEEMYRNRALQMERLWRMGPLGFVYGVVLRK